ncbi:methyltransferase domain-containing protein [Streptomyces sp. NPDC004031]
MRDYDAATYGERFADLYDDWHPVTDEVDDAVTLLGKLAGSGPALELGVGTGRFALPLAASGLPVHGIESSRAMIDRLRAKPGAELVTTSLGDFADVAVEGEYGLVFVTFNTFWMLLSQDDQVRCCENVARRLSADGTFVVEGSVPSVGTLAKARSVEPARMTAGSVALDLTLRDPVNQRIDRQQLIIDDSGIRLQPLSFRYVWPSELDLMARLAGLRLRTRYAGWTGEPFHDGCRRHISVYERA